MAQVPGCCSEGKEEAMLGYMIFSAIVIAMLIVHAFVLERRIDKLQTRMENAENLLLAVGKYCLSDAKGKTKELLQSLRKQDAKEQDT